MRRVSRPNAASGASANDLSARQHLLLQLLDALGGSSASLDFQKVLFLYCQEPESGRPFDFIPYKFGAFSFTSYAERRKLVAKGLLSDIEDRWEFTAKGRRVALSDRDLLVTTFASNLGALRGDALVAETYRRFPYYAIHSEIANKVLKGDTKALARIRAQRPARPTSMLQTIGYEGRTLENYLNELLRAGVTLLCDVRRNPISRKYGFSKSTLCNACSGLGIRYEHLPELGIASDRRQELNTKADYDALFEEYERKHLPKQARALERIGAWVKEGNSVALTCFENLTEQCHRHCIAEALETRFGKGFRARHL